VFNQLSQLRLMEGIFVYFRVFVSPDSFHKGTETRKEGRKKGSFKVLENILGSWWKFWTFFI